MSQRRLPHHRPPGLPRLAVRGDAQCAFLCQAARELSLRLDRLSHDSRIFGRKLADLGLLREGVARPPRGHYDKASRSRVNDVRSPLDQSSRRWTGKGKYQQFLP